jgi:L-ascorbate metabolism protein UlaG (beta-lactamase superfamily)
VRALEGKTALVTGATVLVCPEGIGDLARERSDLEPSGLREFETVDVAPFRLTAVHAEHPGAAAAFGYVVETGPWRIYHAGDTSRRPIGWVSVGTSYEPASG